MKHEKIFSILEKMAESIEPAGNQRLTACLVYRNNIVSFGHNKMKSHPFQKRFGKNSKAIFLHSEIDCIKNALRNVDAEFISKCTMYILRIKQDEFNHKRQIRGMSRPCEGCLRAIATFGIGKVVYTTENGFDFL